MEENVTLIKDYIYVFGRNGSGQLGIGDKLLTIKKPQRINFNFKIKLIKSYYTSAVIVSENNEIFLSGNCGLQNKKINFTKVNCNFNIKNILFSFNECPIFVTDCNEIYKVTEINSNQLELQKYKFNFQINNNEIHLITVFDKEIYFLLKSNEVFRDGDIKIFTIPSNIKEFYVNYLYFFGVNEFDELLMYKIDRYNNNQINFDCKDILQNLQNLKIDKITVSYGSCLVLTKSKELFAFGYNHQGLLNLKGKLIHIFTKIELKKEISDNIIDIKLGTYNTILYLKRNQFYICGRTFVFGDYSEFKKLNVNSIDPTLNAVQNYGNFFIFYGNNYCKGNEMVMKAKLNYILKNRQLVDLDIICCQE
ncbi:hypothetical protein ABK040_003524 [Willaertia magna]